MALVTSGLVLPLATQASAATQIGFKAQSYTGFNAETSGGAITGQKPESKLWFNDNFWWAAMLSTSAGGAHRIHKLVGNTWVDTGTLIDSHPASKEDILWTGSKLYVLSRMSGSVGTNQFRRFSYSGGTYTLDSGFPVNAPGTSAETTTIARDSTGVIWATYESGNKVQVAHTTSADNVWGSVFALTVPGASNLDGDDISSVISFTDATGPAIGILWSNQKDQKDYFAIHRDGASDTSWSGETALSGSLEADDHISLKTFEGRIYAAVKTSASSSSAPLIRLLVRSTTGSWAKYSVAPRSANNTRPIMILNVDPATREVYVFMTLGEGPNARGIGYKKTSIDNISFPASPTTFIQGPGSEVINDPTSTKQNVNSSTDLIVMASDTKNYWWNRLDFNGGPPPPNNPPVANANGYSATTAAQLSVAAPGVLGNDTDADGDPLTAALVTNVTHGTLALASNGSFTYTSAGGFTGTDSFTYRANDGQANSNTALVTITVGSAANSPPVANSDSYAATTGLQLSVGAPGVLGNDTDANGDSLTSALVTNVTHGTLALGSNGSFTYASAGGFTGTDSFTYRANDGLANSNTATVTISVGGSGSGTITVRGVASAANATATTLTIGRPSGTVAGDVLVASVDARGNPVITASGWTLIRSDQNGTAIVKTTFFKVAGGSEPSTYTFNLSKSAAASGGIIAYAGVDNASPIVAHSGANSATNQGPNVTAPSVNTVAGSMVVGLFGVANSSTLTPPAGMTERFDIASTLGQYKCTSEAADTIQASAGATGNKVATFGTSGWNIGQLIALRPGS